MEVGVVGLECGRASGRCEGRREESVLVMHALVAVRILDFLE